MRREPVITQISDLHFGFHAEPWKLTTPAWRADARNALAAAIRRIYPRPDFLIATGDLTHKGSIREMTDARDFLRGVLDELAALKHAARCIVIPGNHDVWRTTWGSPAGWFRWRRDRLRDWRSVFGTGSFVSGAAPSDTIEPVTPYSLLEYYEQTRLKRDAQMLAERAQTMCEYFPAFQVAFLKLDSNRKPGLLPGHISAGRLTIEQRLDADRVLDDYIDATANDDRRFSDARLVVLIHHHITRIPNAALENWMLLDDAGETARWMARRGARLVLHGHHHRADFVGLKFWNASDNNAETDLRVVSAGSATAVAVDDGHNSFHHIEMGQYRTRMWRPRIDNGESQTLPEAFQATFTHLDKIEFDEDEATLDGNFYLEALQLSVATEEGFADLHHSYSLVSSEAVIEDDLSYRGSVEFQGKNISNRSTNSIPFVVTAVGAHALSDFGLRAFDLKRNAVLAAADPLLQRPLQVFPVRIPFAQPLEPGEEFHIQVTFRLPSVMLAEKDYDMLSLLRFPRGVANVRMRLTSANKWMVGPSLWELRGSKLRRSASALEPVEIAGPPARIAGFQTPALTSAASAYVLFYDKLS